MGKFLKAVTFSFDDGTGQDRRLIEILDRYNLKATFNLNSGNFGKNFPTTLKNGKVIPGEIVNRQEVAQVYKNHEVAVHTYNHPNLTTVPFEEVKRQVLLDKQNLEEILGYPVVGMAYPSGGVNFNDEVSKIVGECGIRYGRTTISNGTFDLQENLLQYKPTVECKNWDKVFEVAEKFIKQDVLAPQIFYAWGHSAEIDYEESNWVNFEKLCKMICNLPNAYYATNKEVLLKKWY